MASELRVDTLKDSSGNNSVGMSYVAEGSAKHWLNLDGTGTIAARDSFNGSSVTDNGTGDYTSSFTTSLGNDDYSVTYSAGGFLPSHGSRALFHRTYATGSHRGTCQFHSDGNYYDTDAYNITVHGDLA